MRGLFAKRAFGSGKIIGAFFATLALVVQPLVPLNIPSAFAAANLIVCDTACDADSIQATINAAVAGDMITFAGNASINHQLTINKALTINGGGFTISPTFTKSGTGGENNATIGIIGAQPVTISNLVINGAGGTSLHGINVYESNPVALNDVTINNTSTGSFTYALVVNGSNVTVNNLRTSGNDGGVNVAQGSGVTTLPVLTINGVSSHTESLMIYRESGTVIDTNNQYNQTFPGVYGLKPAGPANLRFAEFACGNARNVNFITPTWDAVPGAQSYNYRVTLNGNPILGFSPIANVGNVTHVSGAFDGEGLSTFSVQTVYAGGLTSQWATPCAVTYDATSPDTPEHVSPDDGAFVNSTSSFILDWTDETDTTSNPVTYVYQSSYSSATSGPVNALTSPIYTSVNLTTSQIDGTGSAEAVYYWQVRACDALSNCSNWSDPSQVTVDNTKPAVPTIATTTDPTDNTPTFTGTTEAGAKITVEAGGETCTATADGSGNWTCTITMELSDDNYVAEAQAEDAAGNKSLKATDNFTIDTTGPIIGAGADQSLEGLTATLNGSSDDSSTSYVWTQMSGPGTAVFSSPMSVTTGVTVNAYGTYVFALDGEDTFGNGGNVDTVTVRFTKPPVTLTNSGSGSTPTVTLSVSRPISPLTGAGTASVASFTQANPTDASDDDSDAEVLGTNTENSPESTVAAVAPSADGWKFWGIAWYWILLALALIAALWAAFAAWRRRQDQDIEL